MTTCRVMLAAALMLSPLPAAFAAAPALNAEQIQMRERQASMPDTPGTGRFPAIKQEVASLPDHTVYRPANLAALGNAKLGVYIFGNGGCANDGASARLHLLEIASHGYVAVAPGRVRSGPDAPPQPAEPLPRTTAADLATALEWVLKQNNDPASPLHGRVDPGAIAVSGFSCGGLQALRNAADKRVKTVVVMNSGILNQPPPPTMPDMEASKDLLQTLHTPTLYILGGETDIAYPNGMDDFRRIDHVPVFMANLTGAGHGGTYWEPNGGKAAAAVVAWLQWQLRGDETAGRMFTGKACGLCTDPAWAVERKRIN